MEVPSAFVQVMGQRFSSRRCLILFGYVVDRDRVPCVIGEAVVGDRGDNPGGHRQTIRICRTF